MGSRGSRNITRAGKPKKKSRFSPAEGVERARVGAGTRRRAQNVRDLLRAITPPVLRSSMNFNPGKGQRRTFSERARKEIEQVRTHHRGSAQDKIDAQVRRLLDS